MFCVLVVTFYLSEMLSSLFQKLRIEDVQVIGDQLPLTTLISAFISISIAVFIWFNKRYNTASFETADELFKVDWPNSEEAKNSTMITVVVSIIFSLILAFMDLVWSSITSWLI